MILFYIFNDFYCFSIVTFITSKGKVLYSNKPHVSAQLFILPKAHVFHGDIVIEVTVNRNRSHSRP